MEHESSIDYRVYDLGHSLRPESVHLKRGNMKKTLAIVLCCMPALAFAAQTPVTPMGAFPNPATASINTLKAATNTKLEVIEANRQDHVANIATKADKDKVVRVWEDFPDGGDAIAIGTPVWYDGKLYNTIQAFVKASGATPDTFTEYFEVASGSGGTNDYTLLINKPTIPTALSVLSDDSSHRIVTDAEKSAWNAKQTALPWLPSVGPTNGRQILQAVGGCSVETYDTQATCEANAGTWTTPVYVNTSVLSGMINDAGAATDDLWSAAKITSELAGKQADLSPPDQAEAEGGTSTTERAWTAQRVAQAIAALAPGGVDEIVYQAECSTITNGFCVDTDDGAPWYWNGTAATAISGGTVDLTAPGPIGAVTPNTGAFTTVTASSFDTSAPATGETGEIGLQEDPANGTNTITLKAPSALAADVVLTLPAGAVPASATSPCTAGQWWYASDYWYVCVATNTWQRTALATW